MAIILLDWPEPGVTHNRDVEYRVDIDGRFADVKILFAVFSDHFAARPESTGDDIKRIYINNKGLFRRVVQRVVEGPRGQFDSIAIVSTDFGLDDLDENEPDPNQA